MNKLNNKKGISLIVLIITIIVMIILAAAIILSLSSSGIIGQANKAKEDTNNKTMVEAAKVVYAEYLLDEDTDKTAEQYVKDKIADKFTAEELKRLGVSNDGTIELLPIIPYGFTASIYEGEKKISEGFVIYEIDAATLKTKNQEQAKTTYNQYVWVPVNGEFERVAWNDEDLENDYVEPIRAGINYMDNITNYKGEIDQYNEMKASVEKNGGFYIARYEAGKDGTTAVSKKGATVWNFIAWDSTWSGNGYGVDTNDGAAKLSKATYKDLSNKVVAERHLIYGVQWDAALKFIEDAEHSVTNSSTWGNYFDYNDSVDISKYVEGAVRFQTTGYSEYWKAKNIYDMAGNVSEWTYEVCTGNGYGSRVIRGGNCYGDGSYCPASHRTRSFPDSADGDYAFRFVLYIK